MRTLSQLTRLYCPSSCPPTLPAPPRPAPARPPARSRCRQLPHRACFAVPYCSNPIRRCCAITQSAALCSARSSMRTPMVAAMYQHSACAAPCMLVRGALRSRDCLQSIGQQSIEREPPHLAERSPKADVVLGGAQPAQRHDIVVDQSARRSLTAVRTRCSSCCRVATRASSASWCLAIAAIPFDRS